MRNCNFSETKWRGTCLFSLGRRRKFAAQSKLRLIWQTNVLDSMWSDTTPLQPFAKALPYTKSKLVTQKPRYIFPIAYGATFPPFSGIL